MGIEIKSTNKHDYVREREGRRGDGGERGRGVKSWGDGEGEWNGREGDTGSEQDGKRGETGSEGEAGKERAYGSRVRGHEHTIT